MDQEITSFEPIITPATFPRVIYLSTLCFRMSNFQRTRSKVWWGDSPPTIGSPIPQNRPNDEPDWEPQLPHWIANQHEEMRKSSEENIVQPNNVQINQWPLRHGSPGSHKSQDSGFSDSDSSPPPSQYYASQDSNDSSKNMSSSSSKSNNNENVTVKLAEGFQSTPSKDVVDSVKINDNISSGAPTPKPRLRSSSVIQTPYDLQKYYEIHHDEEHIQLLKDKEPEEISIPEPKYPAPKKIINEKSVKDKTNKNLPPKPVISNLKPNIMSGSKVEVKICPTNNISNKENTPNKSAIQKDTKEISDKNLNMISPSKKYPVKKSFVSNTESITKTSKVAKVKDLETSKNKSDENLEYIKLSDNNEIAVKNQPRIRTPISNISYIPTERISSKDYRRSMSYEENIPIDTTPQFQRNKLNKSLNFEAQRLDQQILDIHDGYHSLGHIEEDEIAEDTQIKNGEFHKPARAILGKNITDSLHLKPTGKKSGFRLKQRLNEKKVEKKELFRLFSGKREKPQVVKTHAGGIQNGSREPPLDLPRAQEQNSWVIVGYPEQERLIPNYNERLVATDSEINLKAKNVAEEDLYLKNRNLTPPPEFQDKQTPYEADSKTDRNLTHDSKREKLKEIYELNFDDVQLNLACTSTPKMLAPHEYMDGPNANRKTSLRVNLLENFSSG